MLNRREVKVLLRDVAQKMNTGERHAFCVLCSSCNKNPVEAWNNFEKGKQTPEWFVDACIDIMTDKIYLLKGVVHARRRRAKSKV